MRRLSLSANQKHEFDAPYLSVPDALVTLGVDRPLAPIARKSHDLTSSFECRRSVERAGEWECSTKASRFHRCEPYRNDGIIEPDDEADSGR